MRKWTEGRTNTMQSRIDHGKEGEEDVCVGELYAPVYEGCTEGGGGGKVRYPGLVGRVTEAPARVGVWGPGHCGTRDDL